MAILAQHGYGKASKIENAINDGSLSGVILSPNDMERPSFESYTSQLARNYPSATRIVDPLVHAQYFRSRDLRRGSKLRQYPYFAHAAASSSPPSRTSIQAIVQECLDWQANLPLTHLVSPTICISSLNNPTQLSATEFAIQSIRHHQRSSYIEPLLVSFVIEEDALADANAVANWLGSIRDLECYGFYIVIRRSITRYEQTFLPHKLLQLLNICYVLSELSRFNVIMGYTDMLSLLLHAVGVADTGTGWYFNLRWFSDTRFYQEGGGNRDTNPPRYSAFQLLNSIRGEDLTLIQSNGLMQYATTGGARDATAIATALTPNGSNSTDPIVRHHWAGLAGIVNRMTSLTISDRLDIAERAILIAQQNYHGLSNISFVPPFDDAHLHDWAVALREFRQQQNL